MTELMTTIQIPRESKYFEKERTWMIARPPIALNAVIVDARNQGDQCIVLLG
jgi:hypothetical protein